MRRPSTSALRAYAQDDTKGTALRAYAQDDTKGGALRAYAQDDTKGTALCAYAQDDTKGTALRAYAHDDTKGGALRAYAQDETKGTLRSRDAIANVWALLDEVMDPELPAVSITDLGIVREVRSDDDELVVALTPTYSGCPATEVIERDVLEALRSHGIERVRIERRLAPLWTTDWITPRGRARLEENGIAPPAAGIGNTLVILSVAPERREVEGQPPCPRCASQATTELSRFGSTPCKALYRCDACREPFDYVKPH